MNWEDCGRKGIQHENGGDDGDGSLISPVEVEPSQIVDVSASDISPCTIKPRRSFLLAPAHLGSPRKRPVKWFCVCYSVFRFTSACMNCVDLDLVLSVLCYVMGL